ncbi:hypothetical protein PCE1_002775 [Barthelona sp. PCE]
MSSLNKDTDSDIEKGESVTYFSNAEIFRRKRGAIDIEMGKQLPFKQQSIRPHSISPGISDSQSVHHSSLITKNLSTPLQYTTLHLIMKKRICIHCLMVLYDLFYLPSTRYDDDLDEKGVVSSIYLC